MEFTYIIYLHVLGFIFQLAICLRLRTTRTKPPPTPKPKEFGEYYPVNDTTYRVPVPDIHVTTDGLTLSIPGKVITKTFIGMYL